MRSIARRAMDVARTTRRLLRRRRSRHRDHLLFQLLRRRRRPRLLAIPRRRALGSTGRRRRWYLPRTRRISSRVLTAPPATCSRKAMAAAIVTAGGQSVPRARSCAARRRGAPKATTTAASFTALKESESDRAIRRRSHGQAIATRRRHRLRHPCLRAHPLPIIMIIGPASSPSYHQGRIAILASYTIRLIHPCTWKRRQRLIANRRACPHRTAPDTSSSLSVRSVRSTLASCALKVIVQRVHQKDVKRAGIHGFEIILHRRHRRHYRSHHRRRPSPAHPPYPQIAAAHASPLVVPTSSAPR